MKDSPLFARTYDLVVWLLHATERFPKSQRFVMAQRIQRTAFAFQDGLIETTALRASERVRRLETADAELAKLRYQLRTAFDLGWLSMGQFEHVSQMIDECGRLVGGWLRKEREQPGSA